MYISTGMSGYRRGLGAEAMGPPVDPNASVQAPDVQQQIADVWSYLWSQPAAVATTTVAAPSMTQWLNQNAGKVAIGAVAFVGLMLFAKAGR